LFAGILVHWALRLVLTGHTAGLAKDRTSANTGNICCMELVLLVLGLGQLEINIFTLY
jgi:hypothetical protein